MEAKVASDPLEINEGFTTGPCAECGVTTEWKTVNESPNYWLCDRHETPSNETQDSYTCECGTSFWGTDTEAYDALTTHRTTEGECSDA